jgi:hypothetical protein
MAKKAFSLGEAPFGSTGFFTGPLMKSAAKTLIISFSQGDEGSEVMLWVREVLD